LRGSHRAGLLGASRGLTLTERADAIRRRKGTPKMKRALLLFTGISAWLSLVGCEDAADTVKNTITCADVCGRYKDCFDSSYDVQGCTDRCENEATADEQKEVKLEACDDCIENRSCASAVFSCTTECAGVIIN
jgi:hypothetical protein